MVSCPKAKRSWLMNNSELPHFGRWPKATMLNWILSWPQGLGWWFLRSKNWAVEFLDQAIRNGPRFWLTAGSGIVFTIPSFKTKNISKTFVPNCRSLRTYLFIRSLFLMGLVNSKNSINIPSDVYLARPWEVRDVLETLLTNNPTAEYADKEEVLRLLQTAVQNDDNPEICCQHIQNERQFQASRGRDRRPLWRV